MALDFRELTILFDPTSGRIQRNTAAALFGGNVRLASAALKGFNITFNNGEHPLLRQQIDVAVTAIANSIVTVAVDFLIRDNSGDIDDPFSGSVNVLVVADVA